MERFAFVNDLPDIFDEFIEQISKGFQLSCERNIQ